MIFFKLVGDERPENAVMSVYTSDWMDEEVTMKIAYIIRDLGIKEKLKYKPELYTDLNIFRDGDCRILPTVYQLPVRK